MEAPARPATEGWNVTPGQARASFWILFVATIALTKISAMQGNHAIQVPLVHWLNDRSLYPNDPFMTALARYPSALWPTVAALARVFPLEGTLQALYVLERLFTLYAASRLARALAPGSGLAVVAATALFALPIDSMLGNGTIVEFYLEQTGAAIPCFLLAAAAFHERRKTAWAIWLALGFNLTAMYGTFALTYFGAAFLLDAAYRRAWKEWGRSTLLFLAGAAYGIHLSLAAARGAKSGDAGWLVAALSRGWPHFYPLTWGFEGYVQFVVFLVLLAVVLSPARREAPQLFRHAATWTVVGLVWLADAFVAAYVLHSRPLMMMQPGRATDLLICFGGIAMIGVAASRLDAPGASKSRRYWLACFGAAFLVWIPPGSWIVAVLVAVGTLTPLSRALTRLLSPRLLAWLLVLWVVTAAVVFVEARWYPGMDPRELLLEGPDATTTHLAAWAEAHTPRDAVFLLNTMEHYEFDNFMALAKRSILTSTEEGTAIDWAPDFASEWIGRMEALGVNPVYRTQWSLDEDFEDAVAALTDDDVLRLKQRYRLKYWVVPDRQTSRFPVVWVGYGYQVLEIPQREAGP